MTSSRPYLLRAIYEWLLDNSQTPYIMVNVGAVGVCVPLSFVENGKIVLNVEPNAIGNLRMGNEAVEFDARFKGNPFHVYLPMESVLAIYSFENGRGMVFGDEDKADGGDLPPPRTPPTATKKAKPNLKVIK